MIVEISTGSKYICRCVSGAVGGQPDVLSSVDMMAQQHTADVTSHRHAADVTSQQHTADVTSQQHTADVTSQRHTADVMAQQHTADVTSQRHTSDVTSQQHTADVTSQRHAADVTSQRHTAANISQHSADGDSPSLPLMQNVASLSSTVKTVATLESGEAHNGIEPSLAVATTVDASTLQTPIDPSVIQVRYYLISLMTTLLHLLYILSVVLH